MPGGNSPLTRAGESRGPSPVNPATGLPIGTTGYIIWFNGTDWVATTLAGAGIAGAPASSTDEALARFNGTAGAIQNSGVTLDDSNNMLFPTTAELRFRASGNKIYSRIADYLTLVATTMLELGSDGDLILPGNATLRYMYPFADGMCRLGDENSKGFTGLDISGLLPANIGMFRIVTLNTAGKALTVNAGGATSGATDKAGGNILIVPGIPTGTGRSYVKIQGYTTGAASTSDNTVLDREDVGCQKILTNNTNTALVSCTIAAGSVIAGVLRYAVEVRDGTNVQVEEGQISYHVTHTNAGVLANNTTVKFGNQQAMTSGTLTVTWTITAANPAVLTINANSSLSPSTGFPKVVYSISNLTSQAISIQ